MAGKMCPNCGKMTFHKTPKGRKCSRCDFEMIVPPNEGKGGHGSQCSNCGEYKVRNNKCGGCGAVYKVSQ